jgi:hypothetical protein
VGLLVQNPPQRALEAKGQVVPADSSSWMLLVSDNIFCQKYSL